MEIEINKNKIFEIRGYKGMLDFDLAALYNTKTRILKQAVKRNLSRFPADFMFVLLEKEIDLLVSQNVIPSKSNFAGALPFIFKEQKVAMLSTVPNNEKAIEINIASRKSFVALRKFALNYEAVTKRLTEIENKIPAMYKALNFLVDKDSDAKKVIRRNKIGYNI